MKEFRGTDNIAVAILNELCKLIDTYGQEGYDLEAVLYVGRKEIRAINTISSEDPAINRNLQTGELKLWGIPVVVVLEESFAGITPTKILRRR